MKKNIFLLSILALLVNCSKESKVENKISKIEIQLDFENFHQQYFSTTPEKFQDLKQKFPYLFPKNIEDSVWLSKLQESDEKILFEKVDSVFENLSNEKEAILNLYKHISYYNSSFKAPKTITVISNLDYEHPIIYADTLAFVSLDMFLGKDSEVYSSFPKYIANTFTKEQLIVALAREISKRQFYIKNGRSFIETMLYHGKKLYLLEKLLPDTPKYDLIGYSEEQYNWALANEGMIWSYFVSNEMLFSTDKSLNKRFIDKAPFSKFYMDLDARTPGSIGKWVGYAIVKAYAARNQNTLQEILTLDAETLFVKSKYKPKK
ncbi:MAG: gliding motility lipoprotein GldB [Flavicella sp.]